MLNESDLEELERKYFNEIVKIFLKRRDSIGELIESMKYTKRDWFGKLKDSIREPAIIQQGAERITWSFILRETEWNISTIPVGANLCFEMEDAIIHIDDKTVFSIDSDAKIGRIVVESNQISYRQPSPIVGKRGKRKKIRVNFEPSLPQYYIHKKKGELLCVSAFVQFVYNPNIEKVEKINLCCVPNGQLSTVYGDIFEAPKNWIVEKGVLKNVRVVFEKIRESRLIKGWKRVVSVNLI